jgi:hypothetical protein
MALNDFEDAKVSHVRCLAAFLLDDGFAFSLFIVFSYLAERCGRQDGVASAVYHLLPALP